MTRSGMGWSFQAEVEGNSGDWSKILFPLVGRLLKRGDMAFLDSSTIFECCHFSQVEEWE